MWPTYLKSFKVTYTSWRTAEQTLAQKEDFLKSWRTVPYILPPFKPKKRSIVNVGDNKIHVDIVLEGSTYCEYLRKKTLQDFITI